MTAQESFVVSVQEQFGFTAQDAAAILEVYKRYRAVKFSATAGGFTLAHGALWERSALQAALDIAKYGGVKK